MLFPYVVAPASSSGGDPVTPGADAPTLIPSIVEPRQNAVDVVQDAVRTKAEAVVVALAGFYSFTACRSRLTIDHASLSRRSAHRFHS